MGVTEFSGRLKASFCEHKKLEDNLFDENALHEFGEAQPFTMVWAITTSAMTPIFGADWWI